MNVVLLVLGAVVIFIAGFISGEKYNVRRLNRGSYIRIPCRHAD